MTMTDKEFRKAMEASLHKEAIRERLYSYCRAVNRGDADLLNQVFHPDATAEYGELSKGPASAEMLKVAAQNEGFRSKYEGMKSAHHLIGNILIELEGHKAKVESYVYASYRTAPADGLDDMAVWGRYLDHFEQRQGEWKIAHRLALFDGARVGKANVDWDEGLFAALRPLGRMDRKDPLYSM
jgi:ketosteroid isomerase-like protein